jgi:hypothetical protein
MVVAVVVAEDVDVEAIKVEVVVNHLAEFILIHSLMRRHHRSARGTWRRDSASSVTSRDIVCLSARSGRARHLWNSPSLRSYDGGKAILPANWSSRLHLLFVLRHF